MVRETKKEAEYPKPNLDDLISFQAMMREAAGWSEGDEERFANDPCTWDIEAIFNTDKTATF